MACFEVMVLPASDFVERFTGELGLHNVVIVISNVQRGNPAAEQQALGGAIHRLIQNWMDCLGVSEIA